jgi:hypothetical protein
MNVLGPPPHDRTPKERPARSASFCLHFGERLGLGPQTIVSDASTVAERTP